MKFRDEEIDKIRIEDDPKVLANFLVTFLCAKDEIIINTDEYVLLCKLLENLRDNLMNYRQLNELLLLLNQDTVSKDFFEFFLQDVALRFHLY